MVCWEDVQADALPRSTDDGSATVQGASKVQQIGKDAALKIMQGILDGAEIPIRSTVMIVDLTSLWRGEFRGGFP